MVSTMMIKKTPLDAWISGKIGAEKGKLTRQAIELYQLQKLRETIRLAYSRSQFYRNFLKGIAEKEITCLSDLMSFPFTTAEDIREHSLQLLCVSQDEIGRVVTLETSGTTGKSKRIYFTPADQELTIDFFQQGMSTLAEAGDRVMILLPCEREGSVGDLLATALARLSVRSVRQGIVRNILETLNIMHKEKVNSMVGVPVQVLALARYADAVNIPINLKSVLLSTDYTPAVIVRELEHLCGCRVFEHYGMTEMGLGGGVECEAHCGYHLRESDLFFEIVDSTGNLVSEGQEGEVVFTTLTRQGMPLIRYRTGDVSRFLPGPCKCGTVIRRLDRITRRKNNWVSLSENQHFNMSDLDEAIFAMPGVIDYTVSVNNARKATLLNIEAVTVDRPDQIIESALAGALDAVEPICETRRDGKLKVIVKTIQCDGTLSTGTGKRKIMESL
jgi:phenylacetate-CoA ligase